MEQIISSDLDFCRDGSSFDFTQDATHPCPARPQPDTGPVIQGPQLDTGRLYLLIAPHPAVDRLMDALAVRLALAADANAFRPRHVCRRHSTPPLNASGPYLHILDSGNRFDLHGIARGIARGIAGGIAGGIHAGGSRGGSVNAKPVSPDQPRPAPTVEDILQRIRVARAFTCYQAEALFAGVAGAHGVRGRGGSVNAKSVCPDQPTLTPTAGAAPPAPVLAPGLLTPFADENVPLGERLRLLGRCIQHLKRLARDAPVLVSAAPVAGMDSAGVEAAKFLARLETAADQVWRFEAVVVGADHVRAGRILSEVEGRPAPPTQLRMF